MQIFVIREGTALVGVIQTDYELRNDKAVARAYEKEYGHDPNTLKATHRNLDWLDGDLILNIEREIDVS
jgi:hypothetical protein